MRAKSPTITASIPGKPVSSAAIVSRSHRQASAGPAQDRPTPNTIPTIMARIVTPSRPLHATPHPMQPAFLLDLDGVLVDSAPVHAAAWRALFAPFGVDFGPDRYAAEANGRSRGDVIRAVLGERADHEALMRRKAELVRDHLDAHGCPEVPGAGAFLRTLRERGHPFAVATASRMPEDFLRAAGLDALVDVIADRTMVEHGKPAPDVFLLAAYRLGVDPARCVVVEDSPAGLAAARTAGCHTVGITTNHSAAELDADLIVSMLDEVLPAITRD